MAKPTFTRMARLCFNSSSFLSSAVVLAATFVALPQHALAQTWDGQTNSDFLTGTNWDGDVAPSPGGAVVLDDGGLANQPTLDPGDSLVLDTVDVSAGTLTINGQLTTTTGILVSGGTLNVNGLGEIISSDIDISGGALNVDAGGLVGVGSVDLSGTGTFNVTGANSVNIVDQSGGTISGAGPLTVNGTFDQSGGELASGAVVNVAGAKTLEGGTIAGTLGGAGATTIQTGTTTVSGNIVGDVTVASGKLRIEDSNAIGGAITTTGSVISYADGVNEGSALILNSNTTQVEVLGTDAATQSGVISELNGPRPLEKIGTGKLTLSAPINTFLGDVTISKGTLEVTSGRNIGNFAEVKVGNDAKFVITTQQEVIGNLSSIDGNAATSTAKVELNTASNIGLGLIGSDDTTFAGDISGTGQLTVQGGGTLTLTGVNSLTGRALTALAGEIAYTGNGSTAGDVFAIEGGLITTDGGAIGSNRRLVVTDSTATLTGSETIGSLRGNGPQNFTGTVNLNGASTVLTLNGTDLRDSGVAGTVKGTGTLNVIGRTTTVASAGVVNTKSTVGAAGTLVNNGSIFDIASAGTFTNAGAVTGSTLISGGTADLNVGTNLSDTLNTTITGGVLNVNAADTVGALIANGGVVNVNSTLTSGALSGTAGSIVVTAPAGLIAGASNTGTTFGGIISGTGFIQKDGTGSLTLTGANTFTGNTTVSAGRLDITGAGSVASGNVTVGNSSILLTDGGALAAAPNLNVLGQLTLTGSETVNNVSSFTGALALQNAVAGDQFLAVNGNFVGGNGLLALDTNLGGVGATADKLVVFGNTSGVTRIGIIDSNISAGAYNPNGIALVEVDGTTAASHFKLQGGPISKGFFTYDLALDGSTHELVSTLNANAVTPAIAVSAAQSMFVDNADAWSSRQDNLRDGLYQSAVISAVADPVAIENQPWIFWRTGYGSWSDRNASSGDLGYKQSNFGTVGGVDVTSRVDADTTVFFGLQSGYAQSKINIEDGLGSDIDLEGFNLGAYASVVHGGLFANTLLSADFLESKITMGALSPVKADTTNFGIKSDIGYRFDAGNGFFAEPMVSMVATKTDMDSFSVGGAVFNESDNDMLLLGAGARFGVQQDALSATLTARVWNNASGDNSVTMVPAGPAITLTDSGLFGGTYGEVEGNLNFALSENANLFAKAKVKFDDDASAVAGLAGFAFKW